MKRTVVSFDLHAQVLIQRSEMLYGKFPIDELHLFVNLLGVLIA